MAILGLTAKFNLANISGSTVYAINIIIIIWTCGHGIYCNPVVLIIHWHFCAIDNELPAVPVSGYPKSSARTRNTPTRDTSVCDASHIIISRL